MKTTIWKSYFFKFSFIAGILFSIIGCQNPTEKNIQSEIDRIAGRWVPDQRIGICKVTTKPGDGGALILYGETTKSAAKNEIIKTLYKQGIKLIDSILILPDTIRNKKYLGLVTLSVVNLRKEPDHRSELVSQAILGTPVLILKDEDGWLLMQTPDNYIAWTEKSSVWLMSVSEMDDWKHAEKLIFLENSGWIYSSNDKSGVVSDLVAGSIIRKAGDSKGFTKVILPDGREGFVEKKSIKDFRRWKTEVEGTEENVINVALSFLGLPYLWGGSSSKAVDCSGFVQSVFFLNGLILSRDASLQAMHGIEVNFTEGFGQLKKGDLLFFGSKENSISHVTHVAIYKGDSEYIHSSGRVMINSLDSTRVNYSYYRKNSLLLARRILAADNDFGIVSINKHTWY